MSNLLNLFLLAEAVGPWYRPVTIALIILLSLVSLFIIGIILIQPGNTSGLGEIGGGSTDTFYTKNKSKTIEGKLKRWTIVAGIIFVLGAIALTVIFNIYA